MKNSLIYRKRLINMHTHMAGSKTVVVCLFSSFYMIEQIDFRNLTPKALHSMLYKHFTTQKKKHNKNVRRFPCSNRNTTVPDKQRCVDWRKKCGNNSGKLILGCLATSKNRPENNSSSIPLVDESVAALLFAPFSYLVSAMFFWSNCYL